MFTWSGGRNLATVTKNNQAIASYTYDSAGIRTSKTVNGVTTDYYWIQGVLQAQKTGSEYIIFLYDDTGSAYGFLLKNGTTEEYYYYIFNIQGDVIGIIDSSGTLVVEYTYSAWGELLSVTGTLADTIGVKNPLRYRGYYYDTETGFYYLQSRYYDPITMRFINADSVVAGVNNSVHGYNLFAYAFNNPVNMDDSEGNWPKWVRSSVKLAQIEKYTKGKKKFVIKYDVPAYEQHYDNLCWAYCYLMVSSWKKGVTYEESMADKIVRILGKVQFGVKNFCQPYYPFDIREDFIDHNNIWSLYFALREGPVYAYYQSKKPDEKGNYMGHYVVVTGVDVFGSRVYTNNPNNLNGVSGSQTFDEFSNGFTGMPESMDMKLLYIARIDY